MTKIWAVAKNTIAQALRMKIAMIFIVLLALLLPLMSLAFTGDGTLKGKLQTFINYGLGLITLLLCILTIIISTFTLTSDIKDCQIWTVLTKPVRRYELLLGKLLGVICLDAMLLFAFAGIIYGLVYLMPRLTDATDQELAQVQNEFLTARAVVKPEIPDVKKEVEEVYAKLKKNNQIPEGMSYQQVMMQLYQQKMLEKQTVPVGGDIGWQFYNVNVNEANDLIFVRFKYDVSVTPPDQSIAGRWIVGDDRQFANGSENLTTPVSVIDRKDSIRTVHEVSVSSKVVSGGYLGIAFQNVPYNDTVVIFPSEDGMEVLYKADSFGNNYIRAVLLIFIKLVFLAALGISVSTWLSFPVAILVALVIFSMASISGFILDSFSALESQASNSIYSLTVVPILHLVPQFDKINASEYMTKGELLKWSTLGYAALTIVFIKGLVVWLIGLLIFRSKEIAKVTV